MSRITNIVASLIVSAIVLAGAFPASTSARSTAAGATTDETSVALPTVLVHRNPDCSCCAKWMAYLREAGFKVEERASVDHDPIKQRLGVPADKKACHTAEVGGYFIEGHVPADDIKRLLAERPDAKGLAVPGMPPGSPGMDVPPGQEQPFDVLLIGSDGSISTYSHHSE